MRKLQLFCLTATCLNMPFQAYSYTLQDAVSAALQNNISLQIAENSIDDAAIAKRRAFSGFLPSIAAQVGVSKTNAWGSANPSSNGVSPAVTNGVWTIQQELFASGKSMAAVKAAAEGYKATELSVAFERDNTILQAAAAYQGLISSKAAYRSQLQNKRMLEQVVKEADLKVFLGIITKTEAAQAHSELALTIANLEKAAAEMKNAAVHFTSITGMEAPVELTDVGVENMPISDDLESLLKTALENNAGVRSAKHRLAASKAKVKGSYAGIGPTVNFNVALNDYNNTTASSSLISNTTYALTVNMPIFQQGLNQADIQEARFSKKDAELRLSNSVQKLNEELVKAWQNYRSGKLALSATKEAITYQGRYLDSTNEQFKVGSKTLTDLLEAQARYQLAVARYIDAKSELFNTALAVRFLLGDLSSLDLNTLNDPNGDKWLSKLESTVITT